MHETLLSTLEQELLLRHHKLCENETRYFAWEQERERERETERNIY